MKVNDFVLGLLFLIFCMAGLLYTNLTFPFNEDGTPGPAFFPNVLFSLLALCAASLCVSYFIKKERVTPIAFPTLDIMGVISIVILLGFVLCYIYFSDMIGFMPLSFGIIFCLSMWLKVSWKVSLISAVVTTIVIYLIFVKILLVPLPQGIINF